MKSKEFANYLKDLRKRNKISQKQLANYSKFSEGYISQIETLQKEPSADFVIKIAKYLRVNEVSLLQKAGLISEGITNNDIKIDPNYVYIGELEGQDKNSITRLITSLSKRAKKNNLY
jgi:transcriptional regulator with XRE-family HTH domain